MTTHCKRHYKAGWCWTQVFSLFTHILSYFVSQNIRFDRVSLPWICFHYKPSIQSLCLQMCPNLTWTVNCQQPPTLMSLLHIWSWMSTWILFNPSVLACLTSTWIWVNHHCCLTMSTNCTRTLPPPSGPSIPGNSMTTGSHGLKPMQWGSFRHITSLRLTNMSCVISITVLYMSHNTAMYTLDLTGERLTTVIEVDRCSVPSLAPNPHHTSPLQLLALASAVVHQTTAAPPPPLWPADNTGNEHFAAPLHCCKEPALPCSRFRFPPKPLWKTTWWGTWLVC